MARSMPKSIQSWLIPKLRRNSQWWPGKSIARDQAKVKVTIGHTKEGKPKYRVFYKCAQCVREGNPTLYTRDETQADHILAVVDESTGFVDWNEFIERLFCDPDGYQILCKNHHNNKTVKENKVRKTTKKVKK